MAATVRGAGCHAAGISSSIDPAPGVLERELPELVRELDVPVFLGGATSVRRRASIAAAKAIPLGSDIDLGVRAIAAALAGPGKQS